MSMLNTGGFLLETLHQECLQALQSQDPEGIMGPCMDIRKDMRRSRSCVVWPGESNRITVRKGYEQQVIEGVPCSPISVGIIGAGNVGQALGGRLSKAPGFKVVYSSRTPDSPKILELLKVG